MTDICDPKVIDLFERKHQSHRLMLLEEGMDIKEISIPSEDSQFLESRRLEVRGIMTVIYFDTLDLIG